MRTPDEVLNEIANWAQRNEAVRVVILTGSRAALNAGIDLFSDYDIEIAVTDTGSFLGNEEWLLAFGKPLAIIRIDEDFTMRMVIYKDYIRIDFRIYSVKDFIQRNIQAMLPQHLNNGYKILLDKDQITQDLQSPAYNAYVISKPSKEAFSAIVADFLWDTTYVAKSLWRDELFYAKYMFDNIIRTSYLEKIIEWYISMQHNWQISTNKHGRFFKYYLDAETFRELKDTFAGSEREDSWNALFATLNLFRRLAMIIAAELNYLYPKTMDTEITAYLNKIKTVDIRATDIK